MVESRHDPATRVLTDSEVGYIAALAAEALVRFAPAAFTKPTIAPVVEEN